MTVTRNGETERRMLQSPGCAGDERERIPLICEKAPALTRPEAGCVSIPVGGEIRLQLDEERLINTVALREQGSRCTSFALCGEDHAGKRTLLYENDVIDRYLYCAFEPVKVSALILEIRESHHGQPVRLCNIEAFYIANGERPFRTAVYFPLEKGSTYFTDHLRDPALIRRIGQITDIVLIGDVRFQRSGALSYDEPTLTREMGALREMIGDRRVRIWCCVLNPLKKNGKLSNPDSVYAIRRNLDVLIQNITALCGRYGFDGIDFDWEFPLLPHAWHAHGELLIRLGEELHRRGLLLSAAFGPWGIQLNRRARESLDFVNVMAYDWPKNWRKNHAEFYTCHYFSACYFLKKGFPKERLLLGIPFYGNTCGGGKLDQRDYSGFEIQRRGQNTGSHKGRTYYFNGSHLIYSKCAYNRDMGFAGTMVWCGKADLAEDGGLSLFCAMERAADDRRKG